MQEAENGKILIFLLEKQKLKRVDHQISWQLLFFWLTKHGDANGCSSIVHIVWKYFTFNLYKKVKPGGNCSVPLSRKR